MKYINRSDIDFKDDCVFHSFYRTFRSSYVHLTGLPVFDYSTYKQRAPLVTKSEAKEKHLMYDETKIYGFARMTYGFVPLYLPFGNEDGTEDCL